MAKRRPFLPRTRTRTRTVIQRVRSGAARQSKSSVRRAQVQQAGAALLLGYAKRQGWALPMVGGLHLDLVLGAAAAVLAKNQLLRNAGQAALTIGLYNVAKTGELSLGADPTMSDRLPGGSAIGAEFDREDEYDLID